ncbi:DUF4397 domain-containing protein [Thalassotalea fusca]
MHTESLRLSLISVKQLTLSVITMGLLAGCNSSDSDGSNAGYIKMYNASVNSPAVQMVIDDYTYPDVNYAEATSYYELASDDYTVEVQWQSDEDSFETIFEQSVDIKNDNTQLMVVSGDFNAPKLTVYQYEDESPDDDDNEEYTFRWLNLHTTGENIDVYISDEHETFAQATLISSLSHELMTDSFYNDLGKYKFYITLSGQQEVLFESEEVNFAYQSQYIMVVRDNTGPGDSLYSIDKLSKSASIERLDDIYATAELRVYNGAKASASIDLYLEQFGDSPVFSNVQLSNFSDTMSLAFGDYSMHVKEHTSNEEFINNHLLTLTANSDKTVFFYTDYPEDDDSDDDSDSDTPELPTVMSLTVDNSNRVSIYDHQINVINFIQEHTLLDIFFVRSDETIETAQYKLTNQNDNVGQIVLPNNTYRVFVTTMEEGSQLLLAQTEFSLDENSGDLFIVTEQDDEYGTDFSVVVTKQ